jgi:hypothetical protein
MPGSNRKMQLYPKHLTVQFQHSVTIDTLNLCQSSEEKLLLLFLEKLSNMGATSIQENGKSKHDPKSHFFNADGQERVHLTIPNFLNFKKTQTLANNV